jgi:hypothetical protein
MISSRCQCAAVSAVAQTSQLEKWTAYITASVLVMMPAEQALAACTGNSNGDILMESFHNHHQITRSSHSINGVIWNVRQPGCRNWFNRHGFITWDHIPAELIITPTETPSL